MSLLPWRSEKPIVKNVLPLWYSAVYMSVSLTSWYSMVNSATVMIDHMMTLA
jgi:hypothetical protein